MLKPQSKVRIIENFYALDYALLGKTVQEVEDKGICCPGLLAEYLSVKGALMSIMIEMYKLVDHSPKTLNEKVNEKTLKGLAFKSSRIAREGSIPIVKSSRSRADIKNEVASIIKENSDVNVSTLIEMKTREKAFSLTIDNLLIARTITESRNYKKLNEWEGKILEESYKVLRNDLVESAMMIVDSIQPDVVQDTKTKKGK